MCPGTLTLAIEGKGARTPHCGDQENDGKITWKVWPEPGREPQEPQHPRWYQETGPLQGQRQAAYGTLG